MLRLVVPGSGTPSLWERTDWRKRVSTASAWPLGRPPRGLAVKRTLTLTAALQIPSRRYAISRPPAGCPYIDPNAPSCTPTLASDRPPSGRLDSPCPDPSRGDAAIRSPPHAAHPISGLGEIASRYDVVLCDVWGVVHNGMQHYPDAVGALARFRERGGAVVLITNAPRPASGIERMLRRLEVPITADDAIVSSGDVTVSLMLERGDKRGSPRPAA